MDEGRPPYSMKAPGAAPAGATLRLPGRDGFPPVDDHLDEPEVTRSERIGGRVVLAMPADGPHAIRHSELDYVVRAKVAPGYRAASDLKTRFAEESDFASDTAVFRDGIDPETGRRHLEELAFEVVSEQSLRDVTEKAPKMIRRSPNSDGRQRTQSSKVRASQWGGPEVRRKCGSRAQSPLPEALPR